MKRQWVAVLLTTGMVTFGTWAQSPNIVSFHGNGDLSWTNANTNLFYQIEWASALVGSGVWHSSYTSLADVRASSPLVTVGVPMFYRVSGVSNRTQFASVVRRTGQLAPYASGDDGSLTKGCPWPNPRFTDNGNGTVTDDLTGLTWLKDANAFGLRNWATAVTDCNTLNSGEHGLTDGSLEGDWRLPNVQELLSLIDYSRYEPALCNTAGTAQWTEGDPFTNVPVPASQYYWTSTTLAYNSDVAWWVIIYQGKADYGGTKADTRSVWPVRGGR